MFIPIIPLMNESQAGIAFSCYGFSKIFTYYIFGKLIDSGRIKLSLILTLFFIFLVPVLYLLLPNTPLVAKFVEGIAFAGGTVFCFTFITLISISKEKFEIELKKIMILSSIGSLLGPMAGYAFIGQDIKSASLLFLGLAILINITGITFSKQLDKLNRKKVNIEFLDSRADKLNFNLVFLVLIFKGILMGVQPLIAYWCRDIFGFSLAVSGGAYLVSGLGFMVGTLRPRFLSILVPIISFALLELSFIYRSELFWIANFAISFWLGSSLVKCIIDLGWVTTDKAGKLNSSWMAISDIPLMITPALFWEVKSTNDLNLRVLLIGALVLVAFLFQLKEKSRTTKKSLSSS
jgi:MFS family permease